MQGGDVRKWLKITVFGLRWQYIKAWLRLLWYLSPGCFLRKTTYNRNIMWQEGGRERRGNADEMRIILELRFWCGLWRGEGLRHMNEPSVRLWWQHPKEALWIYLMLLAFWGWGCRRKQNSNLKPTASLPPQDSAVLMGLNAEDGTFISCQFCKKKGGGNRSQLTA